MTKRTGRRGTVSQKGMYTDDIPQGGAGGVPGHHVASEEQTPPEQTPPEQTPREQTPREQERSVKTVRAGSSVAEQRSPDER